MSAEVRAASANHLASGKPYPIARPALAGVFPPSSSPDRLADFFTHSPHPSPSPASLAPALPQAPKPDSVAGEQKVVTTELIQKYLNENEQLILAILENQNVGKLQECAQYQARLQQNLMYLAAIADATPKQ
jgi:hypothetical protein